MNSMGRGKSRIKPKLSRDEVNNQYLKPLFEEFIEERKALGRVEETLQSYRASYKKFMEYFGEEAEETGNIISSMFI